MKFKYTGKTINLTDGYIYVRNHSSYNEFNACKMGKASNIPDRDTQYATGELKRGQFEAVFEVPIGKVGLIERLLQLHFRELHVKYDAGTEFYDKQIITLIEPYLITLGVKYKKLSSQEINDLVRCNRVRKTFEKINIQELIQLLKSNRTTESITEDEDATDELLYINNVIEPTEHQQYILELIESFFTLYNIGKIVWACGLGKALLSILIVKLLNFKSVAIGIPSNYLQKQFKNEILKIFTNKNNILFVGGDDSDGIKSTTYKPQIIQFLNNNLNDDPKFIISTYHSCHLLVDNDFIFDFKIGDEAHHLVGIEKEEDKGFRLFHKINSIKSLFMTATEKTMETLTNKDKNKDKDIYSMDDETYFGNYIDVKTVHWAIENKKITDYNPLVLKNTEDEIDEIVSNLKLNVSNKVIFISCYMCLKSFEKYSDLTHVLLYTNTTTDAELAKNYINEIISMNIISITKEQLYNNALHSKNCNDLDSEVCQFKNTPYGIISCVYIFGEGFDLPKLNGVCIAGNMQSETRIVQYLLRPNRLEIGNPNKKSYIIIPYIDSDDWETANKSYEKVRIIISQLRNVDENIEQKILVYVGKKQKKKEKGKTIYNETRNFYDDYDFEENSGELNKIKLRLRYSKALGSKFTEEQDEYNYVRSINSSLNIKSKKDYIQQQDIHSNFIASPEEYFKSKGVWNNWYDFMGVDTTKIIQSKQEWINFCKEKGIKSLDDYYIYCEDYDILPKEPADFYRDFSNIPSELGFNRNRRR